MENIESKKTKDNTESCNFCYSKMNILEIKSNNVDRSLVISVCRECLSEITDIHIMSY